MSEWIQRIQNLASGGVRASEWYFVYCFKKPCRLIERGASRRRGGWHFCLRRLQWRLYYQCVNDAAYSGLWRANRMSTGVSCLIWSVWLSQAFMYARVTRRTFLQALYYNCATTRSTKCASFFRKWILIKHQLFKLYWELETSSSMVSFNFLNICLFLNLQFT